MIFPSMPLPFTNHPLATDFGLILMRLGKTNRLPEGDRQGELASELGIPVLAKIGAPGTTEAGDIVWLRHEDSAHRHRLPHQRSRNRPDGQSILAPKGRRGALGAASLGFWPLSPAFT